MLRFNRREFIALLGAFAPACGSTSKQAVSQSTAPTASPNAVATLPGPSPVPSVSPTPGPVKLRYIPGSAAKVEQVIGDFDKHLKKPTTNQTATRFGIPGTDLGYSFEHNGKVFFLFGDVSPMASDPIAFSSSADPESPLSLEFLTDSAGRLLPVAPPGIDMRAFNVPTSGLSLNGAMYVVVTTDHSENAAGQTAATGRSVLARFDEQTRRFTTLREISKLPAGHFTEMTLRHLPTGLRELPELGPCVLMFGTGSPTGVATSSPYLAAFPEAGFVSGEGARYFGGLQDGKPRWSEVESEAAPLVNQQMREVSVSFVVELGVWLMVYRAPNGVHLRYAEKPWGPWSGPEVIFNGVRDYAQGAFIHDPASQPDDGVGGPVAGPRSDPLKTAGTVYAPYLIERFTHVDSKSMTVSYLLSTWNPYVVVRMQATLAVER